MVKLRIPKLTPAALALAAGLFFAGQAGAQCDVNNPLMLCPLSVCVTLQADVTLSCKTPPPVSCAGLSGCGVLQAEKTKWLACYAARSRINVTCFGGGDLGHQQAAAQAIMNVSTCDARIRLPQPVGCADPCP